MVFCTTFIELIPFIGAQAFSVLTGLQLQNVIGPYGFTVSTINIALSSGIYYKAFKKSIGTFVPAKFVVSVNTNSLVTTNVR
uniref:Uncharacterized protein n=1 Tax=Panagrolaimus sp. ES5 TaxID=591445 RepID=A0AC34FU43_9BILA